MRSSRDVINLSGPTRIYYDSAGYNPRYDKSDYTLTNKEGQDVIIKTISSNLTCKSNANNRNQWPNIDTKGKSLSDFASGYLFFGLHKQKKGWVFREWAPNATSIFLIGEFNNWQENERYALKPIGNGNWELLLEENDIKHGDL